MKYLELENLLEIRQRQLTTYEQWVLSDAARIETLERQQNTNKWERWGFFAVGIVVSGSAIVVADRLDDRVLENN